MSEPEMHQMPAESEVFPEAAQGVIKSRGRPGCPSLGVFTFWLGIDPADGELILSAAQSFAPGWAARAGGRQPAARELRSLVRRWLDSADEA